MPDGPRRNQQGLDVRHDVQYTGTKICLNGVGTLSSDCGAEPNLLSWPALKDVGEEEPDIEDRIGSYGHDCTTVSERCCRELPLLNLLMTQYTAVLVPVVNMDLSWKSTESLAAAVGTEYIQYTILIQYKMLEILVTDISHM